MGPSFCFCTNPCTAETSPCLSVSLSVSLPASPRGAAVLKHPSRRDTKLWQGLSRSLKDGNVEMWNLQNVCVCWWGWGGMSEIGGSLTALGHSYCPVSSNNSRHRRSLQATNCSETRLSEHWHTQYYAGEQSASWHEKSAGTFSLFFRGRAWSAKPRGSELEPDPREGTVHAGRSLWRSLHFSARS